MKVRIWNKDWEFKNGYIIIKPNEKTMNCPNLKQPYLNNGYWIPAKLRIPKTVFDRLLKNGNLILSTKRYNNYETYIFRSDLND